VLILRFFHGYYPGEIARVLQTTEAGVAERLRMARAEARACLADRGHVRWFDEQRTAPRLDVCPPGDIEPVIALRRAIFASRSGACLPRAWSSDKWDVVTLAHVVSCRACLDAVNQRLGLPLLADRDPDERLGRGGSSNGGHAGGSGSGTGAGGSRGTELMSALRTRVEHTREDYPQELQIAVNGLFVGSQSMNGPLNEQRVKILIAEQVGFIEIFGEHDTCLLYLEIEPPPSGAVEQSASVTLTGGRQLSATLAFSDTSPTLHVVYDNRVAGRVPARMVFGVFGADADEQPARERERGSRWGVWPLMWPLPLSLRFVIAGILLGVLLASPRQTLAAAERVGQMIVDSVAHLVERMRPRAALVPSRPLPLAASFVSPTLTSRHIGHFAPMRPAEAAKEVSDIELSETALEALRLLDGLQALDVEQVDVERRSDHRLHINGIVRTESRRGELVAVLRQLPARRVRVDLLTLDEAIRRSDGYSDSQATSQSESQSESESAAARGSAIEPLRSEELTQDRVPSAYASVRRYIATRSPTDAAATPASIADSGSADERVRRYSGTLLSRSLQARVQARTLRELVDLVPPDSAEQLSAPALDIWRALVRRHAALFRDETASLRRELSQIFPSEAPDAAVSVADADVWRRARRIFELASTHDLKVRRAFAVMTDGSESLDVSTQEFRQSLLEAEHLADAVMAAMAVTPAASTP